MLTFNGNITLISVHDASESIDLCNHACTDNAQLSFDNLTW